MKDEIDKVKNDPNCSPELKALMESSFQPAPNGVENLFSITLDKRTARCPFLTDDKFCRIQRELGAEYLSIVCSVYPRDYIITDNECYRYCHMSCPAVMNKLLNDEKSADLVNAPVKQQERVIRGTPLMTDSRDLDKHPELKYRGELLELFYEIISDKKHSVETNIVLGALAAQTLSKVVESGAHERLPEVIKQVRDQIHDGANLKSVENIKPNYALKLAVAGKFLKQLSNFNLLVALTDSTGTLNIDLYNQGECTLAKTYKDKPWYLRNIALNLLLELGVPLKPNTKTIFENYAIYAMSFALIKLTAVSAAELGTRADERGIQNRGTDALLTKSAAIIIRSVSHNSKKIYELLDSLKKEKMFSPAYLALFVK